MGSKFGMGGGGGELGFGVWGLGFGVWGLRFGVWVSGYIYLRALPNSLIPLHDGRFPAPQRLSIRKLGS